MSDITQLIEAAAGGDRQAAAAIMPLVYDELRRLAAAKMAAESPGNTLDATALVNEAYFRLIGDQKFDHRGHFFAAAAEAMRRILVEAARRKARLKRGGDRVRVELDGLAMEEENSADDLVALDEALNRLEEEYPAVVSVVKLRYFAGLTTEQAAEHIGISLRQANRHWAFAKAWLARELRKSQDSCD